jgi:hypothetical protein
VTILKDNFATLKEAREYLAENALSLKQIKIPPIDFSEYVK